jgi:hypothetical protein
MNGLNPQKMAGSCFFGAVVGVASYLCLEEILKGVRLTQKQPLIISVAIAVAAAVSASLYKIPDCTFFFCKGGKIPTGYNITVKTPPNPTIQQVLDCFLQQVKKQNPACWSETKTDDLDVYAYEDVHEEKIIQNEVERLIVKTSGMRFLKFTGDRSNTKIYEWLNEYKKAGKNVDDWNLNIEKKEAAL